MADDLDDGVVVGVGFQRACSVHELDALIRQVLADPAVAGRPVRALATIETKRDSPILAAMATRLEVPVWLFSAEKLDQQTPRLRNPSMVVKRLMGCPGVAEGAALAAAGATAQLLVPLSVLGKATAAAAGRP